MTEQKPETSEHGSDQAWAAPGSPPGEQPTKKIERDAPKSPLPDRIGGYRIKRELDTGGMGTVYLAQQEQPRRVVALKVMRQGIASRSALRRFEYEAQILARLRHPNIAQVYEAGTHDDGAGGVPFFVMEFIAGARTLTQYAAEKKLGTRQRLDLFARICDAVHHGHQKGIIHRDLKPANILVDSFGEPKIIDFGVARATDSDLAVTTLQTDIGQLIGTLQYMSPEQCAADPHDLDTRSDVYALGVVLYELLTEQLPYDLTKVAVHEAARVIREEYPIRPSTAKKTIRGDVETITLKALEKDRDRRYRSAEALSDDIQRYLRTEPIQARRPSVTYQLSRFARRHTATFIGVTAVLALLIGAIVVTSVLLVRTHAAEAEATARAEELEKVAEFQASQLSGIEPELMATRLREDLRSEMRVALERAGTPQQDIVTRLEQFDGLMTGVNLTNVAMVTLDRNILDRALEAVDEQFIDQPLIRASLLQTLADTLVALGGLERAMTPQTTALDLRRKLLGNEHPDTLSSVDSMGDLLQRRSKLDEAESYRREAMNGRRQVLGEHHPNSVESLRKMGYVLQLQERLDEAEIYQRKALEACGVLGKDHRVTLACLNDIGNLLTLRGRLVEAEPYVRKAMEGRRRVLGGDHRQTLESIASLATLFYYQSRLDDAKPLYLEGLAAYRRKFGDAHPDTLTSMCSVGFVLVSQGRLDEAESYLREALDGRQRLLGDDHADTLISMSSIGKLLEARGSHEEAEPYRRMVLEGRQRVLGIDHPETLLAMSDLGYALLDLDRLDEAEELFRAALTERRRVLGDSHWATLASIRSIGLLLKRQGELDEAEPYLRESLDGRRRLLGNEHLHTLNSIHTMGQLLEAQGRPGEAEQYYHEALEGRRRVLGDDHVKTTHSLAGMGWALEAQGRLSEAESHFREALERYHRLFGDDHEGTKKAVKNLARIRESQIQLEQGKASSR